MSSRKTPFWFQAWRPVPKKFYGSSILFQNIAKNVLRYWSCVHARNANFLQASLNYTTTKHTRCFLSNNATLKNNNNVYKVLKPEFGITPAVSEALYWIETVPTAIELQMSLYGPFFATITMNMTEWILKLLTSMKLLNFPLLSNITAM